MLNTSNLFKTATSQIILLNTIAFLLLVIFANEQTITLLALQPIKVAHGQHLYTLITSMFMHIQAWHFFANMFTLYFLGNFVERLIGKRRFYFAYITSGIFAGIFWALTATYLTITPLLTSIFGNSTAYGIGASGAIFGLVGILAILTPRAKVYLIAGPIIAILIESITTILLTQNNLINQAPYSTISTLLSFAVIIYFFISLFAIMSFNQETRKIALPVELQMKTLPWIAIVPLLVIGIFIELPIGNIAHLGGLIAGLLYANRLKNKYPQKSKQIQNMFK